jgi:hypothetical protein
VFTFVGLREIFVCIFSASEQEGEEKKNDDDDGGVKRKDEKCTREQ